MSGKSSGVLYEIRLLKRWRIIMNMKKKLFCLALTLCMLISLLPGFTLTASAAGDVYPYYVITKGETGAGNYHVYKQTVSGGGFTEIGTGYADINTAVTAVTTEVSTGSATLRFGLTGTDSGATGTLDIGLEIVNLGANGTYTIKGSLTGSYDYVIGLSGASVEVGGGTVSAPGGMAIYNDHGSGDITVSGGTVSSSDSTAIYSHYGSGDITVSGGTVSSSDGNAICSYGSGNIIVSGGTVSCSAAAYGYAISNFSTGSVTVSSGRVESINTNAIYNEGGNVIVSGGTVESTNNDAIDNNGSGNITVSGDGLVRTGADGDSAICIEYNSSGKIIVSGGTLTSSNESTICNCGSGDITISDGTLQNTSADHDVIYCDEDSSGSIAISGGTLTHSESSDSGRVIFIDDDSDVSVTITGGTLENTGEGKVIDSYNDSDITVSGGKIYSAQSYAIYSDIADLYISGDEWDEDFNTGTLVKSDTSDAFAFCVSCCGTVSISGGTIIGGVCAGGGADISAGRIETTNRAALLLSSSISHISGSVVITSVNTTEPSASAVIGSYQFPGTVFISDMAANGDAKLYVSGGTITNTAEGYPAIFNLGIHDVPDYSEYSDYTSKIYLSGEPSISGSADIWTNTAIHADDGGETPVYYSGDNISEYFGGDIEGENTVAVSGVSDGNYSKFSLTNEGYSLARSGSNLLISSGTPDVGVVCVPSHTIDVTETSSELFDGAPGAVKAEANMTDAFSDSVEVKVTDTEKNASDFGLGAGNEVYTFDISLYIKGTNTKTEPKSGYAVTISLPVPDALLDVKDQLSIVHRSEDGTVSTLKSQLKKISGVWYLVFEATEFSPYALVVSDVGTYDETAGLPYYVDSDGNTVFIGFAANGKYIAPSGVTVLVKQNTKSFTDTGTHWAKDYIKFVAERELFNGTGNNAFSPNSGMTRAMFATVIGRLYERSYGEIEVSASHAFTDCDYDDYYGKYVDWAAKEGIIGGYGNGKFGPDDQITREQMAAILYRFAECLGVSTGSSDTTLTYPDAGAISSWAKSAAVYCQSSGIITGRDGGSFAPQGTATRAEVATIIRRFIENTVK
ncbi:MAG: hypothetical protein EOM14_03865 [Clostridia bacterium]|nr:hypothetical protein [Clostridia bacterium]